MINIPTLQSSIRKKGYTWEAGETPLSMRSAEEQKGALGLAVTETELSATAAAIKAVGAMSLRSFGVGAPAAMDWRNNGGNFVTPIKDQNSCGSCVSFATCATIESRVRLACRNANLAIDFAENQLFFCGCGQCCATGWNFAPALDFCRNTGVAREAQSPYTPVNKPCPSVSGAPPLFKIDSWASILPIPDRKTIIANKGPVVAGMAVYQDFFSYRSGVYRHTSGALSGYHAVSVIGYDDALQCWIAKNSWGPGWGDSGFFKIGYGECGMDTQFPFYDVTLQCPPNTDDRCKEYVGYLRRVIAAARTNLMLRSCLIYYVCRRSSRPPRCTVAAMGIIRNILIILRECPQYQRPFCAAIGAAIA